MLIYVDAPKVIRVYRPGEATDGPKRITLGTITKNTYEFRAQTAVTEDERAEMETVVDSYKAAETARVRAQALSFPEIARQIAAYYATEATDIEKHLISVAVLEMSRAIKKADRPQAASNAEAA